MAAVAGTAQFQRPVTTWSPVAPSVNRPAVLISRPSVYTSDSSHPSPSTSATSGPAFSLDGQVRDGWLASVMVTTGEAAVGFGAPSPLSTSLLGRSIRTA